MVNVQTLSREIGLPFVNVSMNFVAFFKFLNKIGMIETEKCTNEVFDYCQDIIKQHEIKGIDSENPLTFTEALLIKIQKTEDQSNPLFKDLGE